MKAIALLLVTLAALYFAYTILHAAPPKQQQEYEEFGDYFFNQ